jgi:hypothetical protein
MITLKILLRFLPEGSIHFGPRDGLTRLMTLPEEPL